ncbi:hypothetical protein FZZ93_01810 [Halomonas eurihalina]|uniref:Uncharacterized protein n=1 Tax=Halomonas eurihalina TaxID=42566 RepID=A0A5D9DDR3_HALER|nr:hypothetical protein FZZ93_01810 [Halomonas eurihalina]
MRWSTTPGRGPKRLNCVDGAPTRIRYPCEFGADGRHDDALAELASQYRMLGATGVPDSA